MSALLGEFNAKLIVLCQCQYCPIRAALLLFAFSARALPLSSVEFDEPAATLVLVRPWADAAPAEWRGQWIRRLSPRVGHLSQMGLGGQAMQVQKKWTRLEPSIRFY